MLRNTLSILMLTIALLLLAPSPGEARGRGLAQLAYVVSPPPATREVMPRYLPQLPKDPEPRRSVAAERQAPPAHRLQARRYHAHRVRYARSCRHCQHRMAGAETAQRCRRGAGCRHAGAGRIGPRHLRPHHLGSPPKFIKARRDGHPRGGACNSRSNGAPRCRPASKPQRNGIWRMLFGFEERGSVRQSTLDIQPLRRAMMIRLGAGDIDAGNFKAAA